MTVEACMTSKDVQIINQGASSTFPHQISKDSALRFFKSISATSQTLVRSHRSCHNISLLSWKVVLEFIKIKFLYFLLRSKLIPIQTTFSNISHVWPLQHFHNSTHTSPWSTIHCAYSEPGSYLCWSPVSVPRWNDQSLFNILTASNV